MNIDNGVIRIRQEGGLYKIELVLNCTAVVLEDVRRRLEPLNHSLVERMTDKEVEDMIRQQGAYQDQIAERVG